MVAMGHPHLLVKKENAGRVTFEGFCRDKLVITMGLPAHVLSSNRKSAVWLYRLWENHAKECEATHDLR